MFMGFGYNPDLADKGERLDMFYFFGLMKTIQEERSTNWFIYDASSYAIVNRISPKKIKALGKKPRAKNILEQLNIELSQQKRKDVRNNVYLRALYLNRLLEITRLRGAYIDSQDAFRDPRYQDALDETLDYVNWLKKNKPEVVEKIYSPNLNEANSLYLPLEIAEAIYLQDTKEASGKFGPEKEIYFDNVIIKFFKKKEIPYVTLRCRNGPRKPAYLSDTACICTTTPDNQASQFLEYEDYESFVSQYLKKFSNEKLTRDSAIELRDKLKLIGGS